MCHVLIIEDEPLVAVDLQMMLEDEGASSFDIAATEADAVAAARARPPQLITSDVKLVNGTGPKAVATIVSELGPRPVIFITGTPAPRRDPGEADPPHGGRARLPAARSDRPLTARSG